MGMSRQMRLFGSSRKAIAPAIDPEHPMVRLCEVLDREVLVGIAGKRRGRVITSPAGAKPHLRTNVGAVVVRAISETARIWSATTFRPVISAIFTNPTGRRTFGRSRIHVLQKAKEHKFLDMKGLCSDTTAQEAKIPHPNEVGLMNTLAKSTEKAMGVLGRKAGSFKGEILSKIGTIKKLVRKYRLFAKTREVRKVKQEKDNRGEKIIGDRICR